MYRTIITLFLILAAFLLYLSDEASAQTRVEGIITDAETGEPVSFTYIHLEEINRVANGSREGRFHFSNVPYGEYTLYVHRIGYKDRTIRIVVDEESELIEIELLTETYSGEEITVTGATDRMSGANLEHASLRILGEELRRNLGSTLSETLSSQAGFSERSMGTAPGRPVIRGLGDERVLILRDGERTGDVSSQSSDHAVSLDPMGTEEIEIARGPAALAYGANAIGGVINVVSNQIATTVPGSATGTISLNGKSVNSEGAGAANLKIPYRDLVLSLDLSLRNGGDLNTPDGKVRNSHLFSSQNSAGLSYVADKGYAGASFSYFTSDYGIPPDPVGGHPGGVDIDMEKLQFDLRGERTFSNSFLRLGEFRYSFINYNHKELESDGTLGTEFGNLTASGSVKFFNGPWAIFDTGSFGIWGEYVDFAVFGARTPDSNQYSGAAYFIQEGDVGNLHYELGSRFETTQTRPKEERTSARIGEIKNRTFSALATSASLIYEVTPGFFAGSTYLHSFRPPTLEELYSEGPHLAAYSFEIGNPNLDSERGVGLELFLRYRNGRFRAEMAGYRNQFSNFIYARDTGEQSINNPSLNHYQFVGESALFKGVEFSAEADITRNLTLSGSLSYTEADRDVSEEEREITGYQDNTMPLPMIPPLNGSIGLQYSKDSFNVNLGYKISDAQTRLGEFETWTNGYQLLDASAQYIFSTGGMLHTLTLSAHNILDTRYRNHLSRIKDIYPAGGRNITLLYRLYF